MLCSTGDIFCYELDVKALNSFEQNDGKRKRKVVKRLDIPVSEHVYGGMENTALLEAQKKELQLLQQDLKMEHTKDKKNALESYVYEMRDKV